MREDRTARSEKGDGEGEVGVVEVVVGVQEIGEAVKGERNLDEKGEKEREKDIEERWHVGEKGSRILVEVATAYAITKVLLPARIVLSVWGTPWFARAVIGRFYGLFGKKSASAIVKGAETVTKTKP